MGSEHPTASRPAGTERARAQALCAGCCAAFARDELQVVGEECLCPRCAARTDEREPRPPDPHPDPRFAKVAASVATATVDARGPFGFLRDDMRAWCAEASWLPRVPLLGLMAYWTVRHLGDAEYSSVIGALNFGVHELGHVVFGVLGKFLGIAGGTLLQCMAPVVGAAMFLRQRDYFAVAFALAWFATNLYNVAVYVADARSQSLPLVGLGAGEPIHDWGYLLSELGLLSSDQTLAVILRGCGALFFVAALGLGGWLLWGMWSRRRVTP